MGKLFLLASPRVCFCFTFQVYGILCAVSGTANCPGLCSCQMFGVLLWSGCCLLWLLHLVCCLICICICACSCDLFLSSVWSCDLSSVSVMILYLVPGLYIWSLTHPVLSSGSVSRYCCPGPLHLLWSLFMFPVSALVPGLMYLVIL